MGKGGNVAASLSRCAMAGRAIRSVKFCSGHNGRVLTREGILLVHRGGGRVVIVGILRQGKRRDGTKCSGDKIRAGSEAQIILPCLLPPALDTDNTLKSSPCHASTS